jgi:hypothetical protein
MARLDRILLGHLEGEDRLICRFSTQWLDQEGDMISHRDLPENGADHSARTGGKQWHPIRTRRPVAARELVYFVPGLGAEEACELDLILGNQVDRDLRRFAGNGVGMVLLRDADDEPRRLDAALGNESNETAGVFTLVSCGNDKHGEVELFEEGVQLVTHSLSYVSGATSRGAPSYPAAYA